VKPSKGGGAGGWAGALRDAQLGTRPWLLLAGGMIGLGAALYYFFKTVASLKR
jgi:hypothetical protein